MKITAKAKAEQEVKKLSHIMDRMESNQYVPYNCSYVCDRIWWLWKWRKISMEQMESLAKRITYLMDNGFCE